MMVRQNPWFLRQPYTAIVMAGVTTIAWFLSGFALWADGGFHNWSISLLAAFGLGAICVLADIYPIHVTYHTKVSATTFVLFLIAILLPPFFAATVAGLSRLAAELLERNKRGSLPSDIVTGSARWALVALIPAAIVQVATTTNEMYVVIIVAAAIAMFLADVLLLVFELAPITDAPPYLLIASTIKDAGIIEAIQYNCGVLAVVAIHHGFWELVLLVAPVMLTYRALKHMKEMSSSSRQLLESMADAVDLRDPYTGGHSRRVTAYCVDILRELGLSGPDADLIVTAARVHDIGKIGVPDSILHKPDKLTEDEWTIMASHAARGAELLARYPDFARGVAVVRHHHERWDGRGYPDGLAGAEIPLGARIIAVADSFDAMTSDRPYRKGMPFDKAVHILRSDNGQQWDVRIVRAFLQAIAPEVAPRMTAAGYTIERYDTAELAVPS